MTTPTITEAAEAMDAWLDGARTLWADGHVVHLTISPGDMTAYRLTFVPASAHACATSWAANGTTYLESPAVGVHAGLLVVHNPDQRVVQVAEHSQPHPRYVAEKLDTENRYTVLAIGLAWWLMAGNTPADAETFFSDVVGEGGPNPLAEWDLDRFTTTYSTAAA